ncbi:DUF3302 domain-containing protein [Klebsiella sp. I138]|uniref:DUF3302 domain-containing protein n=1 Tax=Klebsiella sp. I138 TaxID=2755385 RepID=UPI003DA9655F
MDFKLQSFGPFLHWLTLVVLCIIPMLAVYLVYRLGKLPGDIARAHHHPQSSAITVCGWMGIITLVLWPLAMVWACLVPDQPFRGRASGSTENDALIKRLHEARQRLARLERHVSQQHTEE